MTFPTAPQTPPTTRIPTGRDGRAAVFRVVAAIVGAFILAGPGGLIDLTAAITLGSEPTADQLLHRWHHIDIAAYLTLLTVGTLVVAARRPRRSPLPVQVILVGLVAFGVLATLFTPEPGEVLVPLAVVGTLLVAAHPERRTLLRRPPGIDLRGRAAWGATVVTPYLLVNLWQNLARHTGPSDVHALLGHWAGAAALAVALLVTAWAAATRGPSARGLAVVASLTLLYLGAAALAHGAHDGAWSTWGAGTALIAALLLAGSVLDRREVLAPVESAGSVAAGGTA